MLGRTSQKHHDKESPKPDFGLFVGVIGIVVGSVFTLWLENVGDLNWKWSATVYGLFDCVGTWSIWSHLVPRKKRLLKLVISSAFIIFSFFFEAYGVRRQYIKEHTPPPVDTSALRAINKLSHLVIAPNPEAAKEEFLNTENQELGRVNDAIGHELSSEPHVTLEEMREERETQLQLKTNHEKQEILREHAEDNEKRKTDRDLTEQWNSSKKELSAQIMPIFDDVVCDLDRILTDIANETDQKRYSDFQGRSPNIYNSTMVNEGQIVAGSNFISIGSNSTWKFQISTTVSDIFPTNANRSTRVITREGYASMTISTHGSDGDSVLKIVPIFEPLFGGYRKVPQPPTPKGFIMLPRWGRISLNWVSIKVDVPDGLTIDGRAPSQNYTNDIDKAVRTLVEAQDRQARLSARAQTENK